MIAQPLAVVVLAAGEGTRLRSARPKVLHPVAGRAMLAHVLRAAEGLDPARVAVVVGPDMDTVTAAAEPHPSVVQHQRLGTGHAVQTARPLLDEAGLAGDDAEVLVLYGDTPLVTTATLARLRAARTGTGADLAVLGFRPAEPGAYGRLIRDAAGTVSRIVEAREATEAELAIDLCNAGVVCARAGTLFALLDRVDNANAKGEYYLTDVVGHAAAAGLVTALAEADPAEVQGVNTRAELAAAEAAMQARLRAAALAGGATLIAPETVTLCADTALAPDVTVEPQVIFGPGVRVGDGATIKGFSHIAGATVAAGAVVGPFARLRPGTELGEGARVGNFVEVKAARLGAGAKANHLSYLGDVEVGAGANVGAGTITCNYDGYRKARTEIGAGAFIGSNTALVAPVRVGAGAIVGAGTTLIRDVADDALATARAEQHTRPGAAARFREARQASKKD